MQQVPRLKMQRVGAADVAASTAGAAAAVVANRWRLLNAAGAATAAAGGVTRHPDAHPARVQRLLMTADLVGVAAAAEDAAGGAQMLV